MCWIAVLPFILVWRISGSRTVFGGIAEYLALFPGIIGSYLRVAFYSGALHDVSREIRIGLGTIIAHPEVSVGPGVYIGGYSIIGMTDIGAHVTISSNVSVLSGAQQHRFDALDIPIQDQGGSFERVRIGANSWIGQGAIIMNHVGVQCVIGAGTVLTKATGDYEVVVGNPGRCIRKIGDQGLGPSARGAAATTEPGLNE